MKRKTLSRDEWPRIIKRRPVYRRIDDSDFRGEAALFSIGKMERPLVVCNDGALFLVADEGFTWLQLAWEDRNYWVTVMFDSEGKIVQYYYDVTDGNVLLGGGDTWFRDMYLDVVLLPDGRRFLLDEEELDEALAAGEISPAQYDRTKKTAGRLMETLAVEKEKALCERIHRLLSLSGNP